MRLEGQKWGGDKGLASESARLFYRNRHSRACHRLRHRWRSVSRASPSSRSWSSCSRARLGRARARAGHGGRANARRRRHSLRVCSRTRAQSTIRAQTPASASRARARGGAHPRRATRQRHPAHSAAVRRDRAVARRAGSEAPCARLSRAVSCASTRAWRRSTWRGSRAKLRARSGRGGQGSAPPQKVKAGLGFVDARENLSWSCRLFVGCRSSYVFHATVPRLT